jgi:hypothetical protein
MLNEVLPTFPPRGLKYTISIHIFHVFPLIELQGSTKTFFSVEKVDIVFSNPILTELLQTALQYLRIEFPTPTLLDLDGQPLRNPRRTLSPTIGGLGVGCEISSYYVCNPDALGCPLRFRFLISGSRSLADWSEIHGQFCLGS